MSRGFRSVVLCFGVALAGCSAAPAGPPDVVAASGQSPESGAALLRSFGITDLGELAQEAQVSVAGVATERAEPIRYRVPEQRAVLPMTVTRVRVTTVLGGSWGKKTIKVSQFGTPAASEPADSEPGTTNGEFSPILERGQQYTLFLTRQYRKSERDPHDRGAFMLTQDMGAFRQTTRDEAVYAGAPIPAGVRSATSPFAPGAATADADLVAAAARIRQQSGR